MAKDTAIDYIKQAFYEVVQNDQQSCVAINETTGIITMIKNNKDINDNMSKITTYIIKLQTTIETIKKHLETHSNEDDIIKKYAAYVYVFSCLQHFHEILEEKQFRTIYMKTIEEAKQAGVEPFY